MTTTHGDRTYYAAQRSRINLAKYERMEREAETLTVHVASETDPKVTYTLHVQGDTITCNCRGYNTAGHCKHQRALKSVLEMEKAK